MVATKMWDVVEFVKKHRGKLVAGASVLGGVYVLKKVVESEALAGLVHSATNRLNKNDEETGFDAVDLQTFNVNQARTNFLFDAHQQSCDKVIEQVVAQVQLTIQQRFDAEAVVQQLKQGGISAKEKIQLWEDLKIKSFGRILAVAYSYPLLVIAFKVQKSILCQETCKAMETHSKKRQKTSTMDGMYNYASSFFWKESEESNSTRRPITTDPQTQQLFSNCINFLTTEGIKELCNRVERVTGEIFGSASLAAEINPGELFQKAMLRMEQITGNQNLSEFVVPFSGPVVSTLANNSSHLQALLKQLLNSLQSIMCQRLLSAFVKLYIDETLRVLNNAENKGLPLAKLIPIASGIFGLVAGRNTDTPFHKILISPELYQFTHLVFDVSSSNATINFV